jgi:NitT/TauT family transport system substrate-binding protein
MFKKYLCYANKLVSFLCLSLSLTSSVAFASQKIRLALNWKPEPQFGGFYEAERLGLFEKNKLKLTILPGGSGTPTLQMLASQRAEYAIVSADEMVLAQDRGVKDLVALFAVYQTNPQAIMTHSERGFQTLEQVFKSEGTILWQAGLPYASFLKKKYSPFKVKEAPYSGGIALFQNNKQISQQVFVTSEPIQAKASKLDPKVFLVAEAGFNPYTTVLITHRKRLTENKAEVLKLIDVVRASWSSYLKSPQATNRMMQKLNPSLSLEFFNQSADAQKDLIRIKSSKLKLGEMTLDRWSQLQEQLKDLGLVQKTQDPNLYFYRE